jgi:transposase-like protein
MVSKHCKYKEIFQRYLCHDCKHTFNDKTGTVFHYSHVPLSGWFLAVYLFCCISWTGISIRATSFQLDISYRICYHIIRAVMERIASVDSPKLEGKVEHDELYVKSGMKGSGYHYDIVKDRMPRKRGLKPPPGRGTFDNDQPMILCCHQRNGRTFLNVPANGEPLSSLVCNTVSYGSTVYTDEYPAYQKLIEYGFEHDTVCHSIGKYARGDVHTNNCECRTNLFKYWLGKFRGVNKYNLHLYAKTFQFLHNTRHLDDYAKFMKILSVIVIATIFYIMSDVNFMLCRPTLPISDTLI